MAPAKKSTKKATAAKAAKAAAKTSSRNVYEWKSDGPEAMNLRQLLHEGILDKSSNATDSFKDHFNLWPKIKIGAFRKQFNIYKLKWANKEEVGKGKIVLFTMFI